VADSEAGAGADFLVGQVLVKLELNHLARPRVQALQSAPHQTDPFAPRSLFVRMRLWVGRVVRRVEGTAGPIPGDVEEGDSGGLTLVVQGEVMGGLVEPAPGFAHLRKMGVQAHKGFLNNIFRRIGIRHQPERVPEKRRFERFEKVFDGLGSRGRVTGLVCSHGRHSTL